MPETLGGGEVSEAQDECLRERERVREIAPSNICLPETLGGGEVSEAPDECLREREIESERDCTV